MDEKKLQEFVKCVLSGTRYTEEFQKGGNKAVFQTLTCQEIRKLSDLLTRSTNNYEQEVITVLFHLNRLEVNIGDEDSRVLWAWSEESLDEIDTPEAMFSKVQEWHSTLIEILLEMYNAFADQIREMEDALKQDSPFGAPRG